MNKSILGIDLGTSSVKIMIYGLNGEVEVLKEKYSEISVKGWIAAIVKILKEQNLADVSAVGLTSQVGTYVVNGNEIISWNESKGAKELEEIKEKYSSGLFMKEISMVHPSIVSYPLPRLLYIKRSFKEIEEICQPKEKIAEFLTGNRVTDKYSWRGLANTENSDYSDFFLGKIGIDKNILPEICDIFSSCGKVTKKSEAVTGLKEGTPVFVGLNDFYASLLGMGIMEENEAFDITGTSEHIGVVKKAVDSKTSLVSSEYFKNAVTYGVTASSGTSLDFGASVFGEDEIQAYDIKNAPIFTPYLNGERAPIFDSSASGTFFGITSKTTRRDMMYSVLEGVAFSIYHIFTEMQTEKAEKIIVSGGASGIDILNRIKATLFRAELITTKISDTSALGACIVAMVGMGIYPDIKAAIKDVVKADKVYRGNMDRGILLKRFEIYKEIYPTLKAQYKKIKEI